MKIAIMQPYLFPYLGYFQLIHAVDRFILYDDVNYHKKGWINRNRIILNGKIHLFSIPLENASQNKLIKDIKVISDYRYRVKILKLFYHAYSKAPEFRNIYPLLEEIMISVVEELSEFISGSIKIINKYLHLEKEIISASTIDHDKTLKGEMRIMDICKKVKADEYINPIGGVSLYDKDIFKKNHINLFFIKTNNIEYNQFNHEFIPNLSIIDVLMFNDKALIKHFLGEYHLI